MTYHVLLCNHTKTLLDQSADLPTCMTMLGTLMTGEWTFAELTNEQTGEVIAAWENESSYGATSVLC